MNRGDDISFPDRIFITGTDTGVGKTVISAILTAGLDCYYWKPVQSGLEEGTDTEWVREKTGLSKERFLPETYRLRMPLSPHVSSRNDGIRIEMGAFHLPRIPTSSRLIIEGAGGIMAPLNEKDLMTDLIKILGPPVILVARSTLGTINHTLLSLTHLKREGIEVMGVVLNGPKNRENKEAIEHFGRVRVLAEIGPIPVMDAVNLKKTFKRYFRT